MNGSSTRRTAPSSMRAAALVMASDDQPERGTPRHPSRRHPPRHPNHRRSSPPRPLRRRAPLRGRRRCARRDRHPSRASRRGSASGFRRAAGRLFAQLRGSFWLSQRETLTSDPNAGGSFSLIDAGLAGCGRLRHDRRLSPGLCAGARRPALARQRLRRQHPPGGHGVVERGIPRGPSSDHDQRKKRAAPGGGGA